VVRLETNGITGLLFDIQGFSVHDGCGCRTLVFLSGCPLRCSWCANPEGQLLRPRLLYREPRCTHSHRCITACPLGAVQANDAGSPHLVFAHSTCSRCEKMLCAQLA